MISIKEKAEEIQAELERWAQEENILKPGQKILFALKVVSGSFVDRDDTIFFAQDKKTREEYLQMSPRQFFDVAHLTSFGVPRHIARRVYNTFFVYRKSARNLDGYSTMFELGQAYPMFYDFQGIANLGPASVSYVKAVLNETGLVT